MSTTYWPNSAVVAPLLRPVVTALRSYCPQTSSAMFTFSASDGKPMWSSSIAPARTIELGSAYWARPSVTMRGALPWIASNIAYSRPMLAEPAVPTPPWICAASSVRMSPYILGRASTWNSLRRAVSMSLAVMMSMYQASHEMPG